MLYQWEVGGGDIDDVLRVFPAIQPDAVPGPALTFAAAIARGTVDHLDHLDALIARAAEHWRLARMAVVDRLVLRLGAYELVHEFDTPAAVVIDEALELTRRFSSDESVPFVNGVLDEVRKQVAAGRGAAGGDEPASPDRAGS
jgi:N utilization substance protein B